jgi:ABC-type transporter Mla MlaB component
MHAVLGPEPPAPDPVPAPDLARLAWTVGPAARREEMTPLCDELALALRNRPGTVVLCDASGVTEPDLVVVALLARLQLTARRLGCRIEVVGADRRLVDLISLAGLRHLVGPA